ncbi:MAG: YggT family protein [Verrucomicrobia bacterium]|nr:YggT family protein [Verrucomicrobiota bacterium]
MIYLLKAVHWIFFAYTIIILVRIIGSWIPKYANHPILRFARFYTDPYLNIFRRLIPPIGGALDLSPMLAFFVLQILERMVLGFISAVF